MRLALALLVTLGLGGSAAAQPPPPAVTPTPHALELAHRIYEAIGGGAQAQTTAERLMAPLLRSIPTADADGVNMRADLAAFIGTELTKLRPQMNQVTERVYAETFSEAELQGLLAFYQSPVGHAYAAKLTEMSARTATQMTPIYAQMRLDTLSHICDVKKCTPEMRAQLMKMAGAS